jgi:exodeoxyribonuclease-5
MTITPTDEQAAGIRKAVQWYRDPASRQYFVVQGLGGTGKSTIIGCMVEELGLPHDKVLYGAFSAKAASVLRAKGHEAHTLHSLIYKPVEPDEDVIESRRQAIADLKAQLPSLPEAMQQRQASLIRQMEFELREMHAPNFVLNTESPLRDASLLIIDEYSMMSQRIFYDILGFGVKLVLLGDHGQLAPPKGECAIKEDDYDVRLETVLRQAADSPIIRLAHMARNGIQIPFGAFSENVMKMRRMEVGPEGLLCGDQVICGYNQTRFMVNNAMRRALGITSVIPVDGEKTIALKNMHDFGLWNGCFVGIKNIKQRSELEFSALLTLDTGASIGRQRIYAGHYLDHVCHDKNRSSRDWKVKKKMVELCPGYCLTTFKYQGSEATNIVFIDDGFGRSEDDRRRFMYTSISRARSGLLLLA